MHQQQQHDPIRDTQNGINFVMGLANVYSTAIEVFLHRDMGHRYLGFQALAVLFVVPMHTMFLQTREPQDTAWFLLFYLLFCFAQRCNQWDRRKSGVVIHSQYNGSPWLRGPKSKVSEIAFKTWVEPTLIGIAGLLYRQADEANGSFLLCCAASMCLKNLVGQHLMHEEVTDMHDSLIEQQLLAERFRQQTERQSSDYDRLPRG